MKHIFPLFFVLLWGTSASGQANTWTQKASIAGNARTNAVGFSIGNKGYFGTGAVSASSASNDFWEYNPTTDVWTQKANFSGAARFSAIGLGIGAKGYIGMGINSGNAFLSDFWEYDPVTNTWLQKASFGGGVRAAARGFSINNKGYVGTGAFATGTSWTNDFWEYDPTTNLWTQKANFPGVARNYAIGFNIATKGYLGTGSGSNSSDFYEYDPTSNLWTQKASFGGGNRLYAVGFSIGNKGFVGTGFNTNYTDDFWEFDPVANTWLQKADFAGGLRGSDVGFSIGNYGYIGSGTNALNNSFNDFWQYTPDIYLVISPLANSTLCTGATVSLSYSTGTNAFPGNVFTAQLSDANGSFANPANIGSISGTTSGVIAATLPMSTLTGAHYRIRIVSSNPVAISSDNGLDLSINTATPPAINITTPVTSFCSGYPVVFTSTISNGGSSPAYQWQKNGMNVGANSSSYGLLNAAGGDVVRCILASSGGGCIMPLKDTSNAITLSVFPSNLNIYPPFADLCAGDSVTLKADSTTVGLSYQWQINNHNIPGATSNRLTTAITGSYHVELNAGNCSASSMLVPVNVYPLPTPSLHANGSYLFGDTYTTYQWNLDGIPIPGATNIGYNAPQPGHYSLTVTSAHGCTATTGMYPLDAATVGNPVVQVFPNPAAGEIMITGIREKAAITISDMSGRMVQQQNIDGNASSVDIRTLSAGVYSLKIVTASGMRLVVKLVH